MANDNTWFVKVEEITQPQFTPRTQTFFTVVRAHEHLGIANLLSDDDYPTVWGFDDARAEHARVLAQVDEAKKVAAKARLENETRARRFDAALFLVKMDVQKFHEAVKAI